MDDDDQTRRALYQPASTVDEVTRRLNYAAHIARLGVAQFGSDADFTALVESLDDITSVDAIIALALNCSTIARCAYFLKRFKIPIDVIVPNVTVNFCPVLRVNPFSSTLLNFNCVLYQFAEHPVITARLIIGLLNAGARVDLVSDLGETPLETFHRSAKTRLDAIECKNIVHAMLRSKGHSARAFHVGVKRILARRTHSGFATLRNYDVVEAFAVASHTLPMELCRMVACAMGVPP